jgi:hypothetical protein
LLHLLSQHCVEHPTLCQAKDDSVTMILSSSAMEPMEQLQRSHYASTPPRNAHNTIPNLGGCVESLPITNNFFPLNSSVRFPTLWRRVNRGAQ